jgi:UDP-4-amino-4,6-dideoxy-N-acetyl-beta-L-altrosamine transaminase
LLKELPYSTQWIDEEDVRSVVDTLRSAWLTQGPAVEAFERALAERCGARHAVAVSSGTAALHLACLALGLRSGSRLVTSPLSFAASANCALYCGAIPDFADVDPTTGNMTPGTLEATLERGRADVVVPVHFGGRPADVEGLSAAARGATILEDACHALGAEVRTRGGWSRVGSCTHSAAVVFSFHPVKPLTTAEGGAILTQDDTLARRLRALRSHGIERDQQMQAVHGGWFYEMRELGYNYRLTDLQSALGLSQLRRLDEGVARRRRLVVAYRRRLERLAALRLPPAEDGVRSAWHLFPVRVRHPKRTRREVYDALQARGIRAQVHYIPIHLHPYYRERLGFAPGRFPAAEAFYEEELSLPLFATLTDEDVTRVAAALEEVLG